MSRASADLIASASETVGPFFHFAIAADGSNGCVADPEAPGEHIRLRFTVVDGDRAPVPDALIEVWQLDAAGHPAEAAAPPWTPAGPFRGFSRLATGEDGTCEFRTIRPGAPADQAPGRQAAHVNVCLFARGLLRHLHTRVYFPDDSALAEDAVLALVPEARRRTLIARPDPEGPGGWLFEIRLQGEGETVFFDL